MRKFSKDQLFQWIVAAIFIIFTTQVSAQNVPRNQVGAKIMIDGKEYFLHVVKQGQGFYALARLYNVSQKEILEANPDLDDGLKTGQVIKIPVISGRNSSPADREQKGDFILHTVEAGQTVYFISRKYEVPVETIYENNPGAKNKLVIGSIIKVPILEKQTSDEFTFPNQESNYVLHRVMPGETLYALSKQYHVSIEKIISDNPALKNGILSRGSIVRLPGQNKESVKPVASDTSGVIESDDYIYHTIKPGQTMYSIGKIYQVDIKDLRAANSDLDVEDLKPGYLLRVPKGKRVVLQPPARMSENDLFQTHKVKRKETLFAISRRYNIDIETLKRVNQEVNFSKLRRGNILKVPKDAWFAQNIATPDEDVSNESVKVLEETHEVFPVIASDSLCVNYDGLGQRTPIKVALLLPFALDATEKANIIETVEDQDTIVTTRAKRIIANKSKVFTEFYEGALLALDSLKKQGVSVTLSVYDIAPDRQALQKVLQNPALKKVDLIIGPARSDDLVPVSNFALQNKIKMVYPLSNMNSELSKNPYLFQINTPDSLMFEKMSNEIVRQASGHNLLVILPAGKDAYADAFMVKLRKTVYFHEFALNKKINYKEYRMTRADENFNSIRALLDPLGKNFVVIPTNHEATFSEVIPTLAGVREKLKAQVTLFGMTEWLRAQSIDPEDMFALHAQIFTFFALDYEHPGTHDFITKYRSWYHTEPHAVSPYFQSSSSNSGFSRYGIWGHDVVYYFVSAMAARGRNFEYCPSPLNVEPLQFNFSFTRISNWGGFYNQGIFLLKFNSDYHISRVPILHLQSTVSSDHGLSSDF